MAPRRTATSRIAKARWRAVRLFAMDVDGILTDGTVGVGSDGTETKFFSILDGLGLVRLGAAGIVTAWISGRKSGATDLRAAELRIPHVIQGRIDKLPVLQDLAATLGLSPAQCAYMGDDDIDAAAMRWAGIGVTVPSAMPAAFAAADAVTGREAGHGAVREVCERLIEAQKGTGGRRTRSDSSHP